MPIRFRCAYCQQLMGIGRRKAGAIVRCPRCAGEVIVPPGHDMAANGAMQPNDFLEAEDFDKALAEAEPIALPVPRPLPLPPVHAPMPVHAPPPPSQPPASQYAAEQSVSSYDVQRSGLFVPTPILVAAAILLVACLVVTFGLGLIAGRWIGP